MEFVLSDQRYLTARLASNRESPRQVRYQSPLLHRTSTNAIANRGEERKTVGDRKTNGNRTQRRMMRAVLAKYLACQQLMHNESRRIGPPRT